MQTSGTLLIVAALWAVLVWRWWAFDLVIPWDSKNQFFAFFSFLSHGLSEGQIPLWNTFHFAGHPSIADPQSLILSPIFLTAAALLKAPSMRQFDLVHLSHFLMGATAIVLLVRRRRWHPLAAILAALVFMLGGPGASRLQHVTLTVSLCYLPLVLYMAEETLDRASWRWGLGFALSAVAMAMSRDQVAFLGSLAVIGLILWRFARAPDRWAFLKTRLPILAMVAVLGIAALAVPTLITLQLLVFSNRPEIGFGTAAPGSWSPMNALTMLVPNLYASIATDGSYWGPGDITWSEIDWTDRTTNYLYLGALPAILLIWHGAAGLRLFSGRALALTLFLGCALIYALGWHTPIFHFLYAYFPGVSLYRRPADALMIALVPLALLSAVLLDRYLRDGRPAPRLVPTLAVAIIIGLGFLVATRAGLKIGRFDKSLLAMLQPALLLSLTAVLLHVAADRRARVVAACVLLALTAAELVATNATSNMNAEPTSVYAVFDPRPSVDRGTLDALVEAIKADRASGRFPRVEMLGPERGWQNAGMVFGIVNTLGYNPLRFAVYEKAVGSGQNNHEFRERLFPRSFRGYRSPLARMLGIEYLMFDAPMEALPPNMPRARAFPLVSGPSFYVYRLPPAAPRAYLAWRGVKVDSHAALTKGDIPDIDLDFEALIDNADSLFSVRQGTETLDEAIESPGTATIVRHRANEVVITAEAAVPTILVLHDLYYPGWEVEVDGERRPMLKANLLFRGVEIGPGKHTVRFVFRPFSAENLKAAFDIVLHRKGAR